VGLRKTAGDTGAINSPESLLDIDGPV